MAEVETYHRAAREYSERAKEAQTLGMREHFARLALSSLAQAKSAEWGDSVETYLRELRRRGR
ncbi:MAG: hypothetical protein HY056_01240 [Proteobacteria bacterium]|nr:hypothetical protein [Pseudomonadota bacterium]